MEKAKRIFNKLMYPKGIVIFFCCILSGVLLFYSFYLGREDSVTVYISYVFSAYSLVILSVNIISKIVGKAKNAVYKNKYTRVYMTDVFYRTKVSLCVSLTFNLCYAVVKFVYGCIEHSVWFGSVAVYYIILSLLRFFLLRSYDGNIIGIDRVYEYKKYRLCSVMLIVVNIALCSMVAQMVLKNYGYQYPESVIYIVAMYTFYAVISAVFNIIKYRKYNSPVLSAAKAISFTTALVSVLSLQTAMLTLFGEEGDMMRQKYNGITGACICVIILIISVYMFVNANRELDKIKTDEC